MAEMPDLCGKAFHCMLQNLVDCSHITLSVANEAENEFKKCFYSLVKESKINFLEFDKSEARFDELFEKYLSDTMAICHIMFQLPES